MDSTTAATTSKLTAIPITLDKIRNKVEELEKLILKYLQHCTQHIATSTQWNIHLILKPKIKLWSTKYKNLLAATKRVEYDLLPKFIEKVDLSLKIDESIISQDKVQATYNQMRQITKEFRTQAMTLYVQSLTREHEVLSKEIEHITDGFPQDNGEGFEAEPGFSAFKHYHNLRTKRLNLEAEQLIYFLAEKRVEGETNKQQEELIKLYDTPANHRKLRNISNQNNTQNITYDNLVSIIEPSRSQDMNSCIITKKKKDYRRLIKRKLDDYRKKSEEYMDKTKAYKCLDTEDPLPDLIRLELAHLYYLPKAHKPGTHLRPITSDLKHSIIKISKFLDELLRPLFDKMASKTTVTSGFELIKQSQEWSKNNMCQETLFCTIDVADLYTMVPQTEGVL
ncbi:unnamed protein product [Rotaria sordida]|uniref:Reverse transcriptase domain-containing protein n=2 Tax=Rotaria sordida TaxID=392033 RepID=A0A819IW26_9BILA|nr:unnamed protein product [Rotaria sordida]